MIRVSKLTDYAMVILAFVGQEPTRRYQAREIADGTSLAQPTVSKLLKQLAKSGILISTRGAQGGYKLSKAPSEISIAYIIESLEGPLAMMECIVGEDNCALATSCKIHSPWQKINNLIKDTLEQYTLDNLVTTPSAKPIPEQVVFKGAPNE